MSGQYRQHGTIPLPYANICTPVVLAFSAAPLMFAIQLLKVRVMAGSEFTGRLNNESLLGDPRAALPCGRQGKFLRIQSPLR